MEKQIPKVIPFRGKWKIKSVVVSIFSCHVHQGSVVKWNLVMLHIHVISPMCGGDFVGWRLPGWSTQGISELWHYGGATRGLQTPQCSVQCQLPLAGEHTVKFCE